jgi:predicted esterase
MTEPRSHLVATTTHGRYLVDAPAGAGPFPVLYGFHGYAESAAVHMAHLARLDPAHAWLRVSVQGLHRFYNRANQVVASWMTREDRLEAIADNAAYAEAVRQAVARDYPAGPDHVVVGFSQGAAQAYRVAARSAGACRGVIALGGDVPPDVLAGAGRLPPVLIGRGRSDEGYTAGMLQADREALRSGGVEVTVVEFDGGHEWTEPFIVAASAWLAQRLAEPS